MPKSLSQRYQIIQKSYKCYQICPMSVQCKYSVRILCADPLYLLLYSLCNFLSPTFAGSEHFLSSLLNLSFSIEITQIRLPSYRDKTCEYASVLRIDKCKRKCCDGGPEFAAIQHRDGHRSFYPLPNFGQRIA